MNSKYPYSIPSYCLVKGSISSINVVISPQTVYRCYNPLLLNQCLLLESPRNHQKQFRDGSSYWLYHKVLEVLQHFTLILFQPQSSIPIVQLSRPPNLKDQLLGFEHIFRGFGHHVIMTASYWQRLIDSVYRIFCGFAHRPWCLSRMQGQWTSRPKSDERNRGVSMKTVNEPSNTWWAIISRGFTLQ